MRPKRLQEAYGAVCTPDPFLFDKERRLGLPWKDKRCNEPRCEAHRYR
jgi:hypothetical protein